MQDYLPEVELDGLGPAMLALTAKQRKFVVAWIGSRGKNGARCARAAGYSEIDPDAAKQESFRLLRRPSIIAAIKEESERRFDMMGAVAVLLLEDLMHSPDSAVSAKAVDSVLDRSGRGRKTTQDIRVQHVDGRSTEELLRMVEAMRPAISAPVPANSSVIDVEAVEVNDSD